MRRVSFTYERRLQRVDLIGTFDQRAMGPRLREDDVTLLPLAPYYYSLLSEDDVDSIWVDKRAQFLTSYTP